MAKARRQTHYRVWLLVMVVFVAIGAFAVAKLQIPLLPTSSPVTQVAADTTLSFAPDTLAGKVGETKTLEVMISSGKNTVTGIEFQLALDSSIARLQEASAGTFFDKPTVLANVLSKSGGSLHFAVGSLTPKQGSGTIVTLPVRLVRPGSATITFSDVKIAAVGAGSTNVSESALPATIVVANP